MKTSETVRESSGIFLNFSARLRSSGRSVSSSNSGLTCSELCGGTSWDTAILPEIRLAGKGRPLQTGLAGGARRSWKTCPGTRRTRETWRSEELPRSIYDVIDRSLLHLPLPAVPVVAGQGEAVPILVVQLRMIRPVIVSRPPRFRPEQGVLRDTLRGQDPVFKLPCALKLVKILGPEMGEIFLQHAQQLEPTDE